MTFREQTTPRIGVSWTLKSSTFSLFDLLGQCRVQESASLQSVVNCSRVTSPSQVRNASESLLLLERRSIQRQG